VQKKVEDIYREQGNAIKQERLERIRADLRIATITVNTISGKTWTDRNPKKREEKTDIPSHEADDNVPSESVYEATPCPTDLQPEGVM
jgi:hypothetical protein